MGFCFWRGRDGDDLVGMGRRRESGVGESGVGKSGVGERAGEERVGFLHGVCLELAELGEGEGVPVVDPRDGLAVGEGDGVLDGALHDERLDARLQAEDGEADGVQLVAAHDGPRVRLQPVLREGAPAGAARHEAQQVLLLLVVVRWNGVVDDVDVLDLSFI